MRNNEDFDMFHVSRPEVRGKIASEGLKAQTVFNDQSGEEKGPGVWVSDEPEPDYGTDIYGIKNKPTGRTVSGPMNSRRPERIYETERDEEGHDYIPKNVNVSDVKRVGHFHSNEQGHTEVHWHPEEECPQRSPQ